MTFLFGHRYAYTWVGLVSSERSWLCRCFFFSVASQAIVLVAVEHARTTGSDTRDVSTSTHELILFSSCEEGRRHWMRHMSAFSVPIRAHESSAFPKNSEDEVLILASLADFLDHMPISRVRGFLSEKFQCSIGNSLIDLRQARPTRIAFLGGEQVMTAQR